MGALQTKTFKQKKLSRKKAIVHQVESNVTYVLQLRLPMHMVAPAPAQGMFSSRVSSNPVSTT
jgi:hypothetical protein